MHRAEEVPISGAGETWWQRGGCGDFLMVACQRDGAMHERMLVWPLDRERNWHTSCGRRDHG